MKKTVGLTLALVAVAAALWALVSFKGRIDEGRERRPASADQRAGAGLPVETRDGVWLFPMERKAGADRGLGELVRALPAVAPTVDRASGDSAAN